MRLMFDTVGAYLANLVDDLRSPDSKWELRAYSKLSLTVQVAKTPAIVQLVTQMAIDVTDVEARIDQEVKTQNLANLAETPHCP
jgi:thioredoxin-like negative regulator of GroEL